MRVLLSEGSGLTARQAAHRLADLGHHVGVVSSDALGIARFTRATRAWHAVPRYGADPFAWLDATLGVAARYGYRVLFPTQEQVAVLAASSARLTAAGVTTAVPRFEAVASVQDRVAAHDTLARLELPQPAGTVVRSRVELAAWDRFPVYAKAAIGTASRGVHRLANALARDRLLAAGDLIPADGIVLQAPADGPVVMAQGVFARGQLVAFHTNLRVRVGARGGASHKRSIDALEVRRIVERLGRALAWHGALSADVVVTTSGPVVIDVNPRLVEPGNACASGVDLVAALLEVALDRPVAVQPAGRPGVATHQLLLAVLGAAERGAGRAGILAELRDAAMSRGSYAGSHEELTPVRHDWRGCLPLFAVAAATLLWPGNWERFARDGVANYALTPEAWRVICSAVAASATPPPAALS